MQPHDSSGGPQVNQGLFRLIKTPDLSVDLRLIDAINEENLTEEDKLVKVNKLIGSEVNINLEDKDGKTALHHSASKGYATIIKTLVEALKPDGKTPLAEAINNVSADGKTPLAEAINNVSADGKTPLAEACFNNHFLAAKALIEAGANLQDLINGKSLLFIFSELGNNKIVEILIREKADLNQTNKDEETPIYAACKYGYHDVVKQLIEAKADLNQTNKDGESPIFVACKHGHHNVVQQLIDAKVDLNQANNKGESPILVAYKHGRHDVVQQLIVAGADLNQTNKDGESPIFVACENGHYNVVQQLIDAGANVNQAKKDGTTPIFIASQYGNHDLAQQLIVAGANVNQAKKDGTTPIFIASQYGHHDLVKQLIQEKARVNKADDNGTTPLLVACRGGHIDVINTLFYAGADVECLKEKGLFGPVIKYELQFICKTNMDLKGLINKITNKQNIKDRDDKLTNVTSSLVFEVTPQAPQNNIALATPKPSSDVASAGAGLVVPIEISSNTKQRSP